jgi:hypothetical protein
MGDRNITRAEVDTVGGGGDGDVGAGVDEKASSQFSVLSSQFRPLADNLCSFSGEGFQFPRSQIFLAELDVVDSGARSFADFRQQSAPPRGLIPREPAAVGDVVQQTAGSHRGLAYYVG